MKNHKTRCWLLASCLFAGTAVARDGTQLLIEGEPGNPFGVAASRDFSDRIVSANVSTSPNGVGLSFEDGPDRRYYSFSLGTALRPGPEPGPRQPLAVGRYPGVQRSGFGSPKVPAMDFFANGRACNSVDGWFEVLEVAIVDGRVGQLAINFRLLCDGNPNAVNGALRYNSEVALTTAQTRAVAGRDTESLPGELVILDGSRTFARSPAGIGSVTWRQTGGPTVVLDDRTSLRPRFRSPPYREQSQLLRFELSLRDTTGAIDRDEVEVLARGRREPATYLHIVGDRGDVVTGGAVFDFHRSNAEFQIVRNFNNSIGVAITGDIPARLDFAGPNQQLLTIGSYEYAVRYPAPGPAQSGLAISVGSTGCNAVDGRFDVLQAEYQADGSLQALAIDFEQHCDRNAAALRAQLRYISTVEIAALEPLRADAGRDRAVARGSPVLLSGRDSTAAGDITTYAWRQIAGPPVRLSGSDRVTASFVAPMNTENVDLVFELTVADATGREASDQVTIGVGLLPR